MVPFLLISQSRSWVLSYFPVFSERRRSELPPTGSPWAKQEPLWTWPDGTQTSPSPPRKPLPQDTRPGSIKPPKKTGNKGDCFLGH